MLSFVVVCTPPIDEAVADGGLEGRTFPLVQGIRRLDVVMAVDGQRRRAGAAQPLRYDHWVASVEDVGELDVHPETTQLLGQPAGRPPAIGPVVRQRGDAGDGDQFKELRFGLGPPPPRALQHLVEHPHRLLSMVERKLISSGSPYERSIGFSRPVRVGDRVQAARCVEIILAALAEAGAGPEHIVRTRTYVTSAEYSAAVGAEHGRAFGQVRPASTMVVVAGLLDPRWKVEIEAEAVVG